MKFVDEIWVDSITFLNYCWVSILLNEIRIINFVTEGKGFLADITKDTLYIVVFFFVGFPYPRKMTFFRFSVNVLCRKNIVFWVFLPPNPIDLIQSKSVVVYNQDYSNDVFSDSIHNRLESQISFLKLRKFNVKSAFSRSKIEKICN